MLQFRLNLAVFTPTNAVENLNFQLPGLMFWRLFKFGCPGTIAIFLSNCHTMIVTINILLQFAVLQCSSARVKCQFCLSLPNYNLSLLKCPA